MSGLYRSRPAVVEAHHWDGQPGTAETILAWLDSHDVLAAQDGHLISLPQGDVFPGDFIVRNSHGSFVILTPTAFHSAYESVLRR